MADSRKVAIVTGAAAGIGRASAFALARDGAVVVASDVDRAGLDALTAAIGPQAVSFVADVSDSSACEALVESAVKQFGRVDILFNNAGITGAPALIGDMGMDNWRRVIDVNLHGVFHCTRAVLPHMSAAGGGVIINSASVDGLVGAAGMSAYVAAKHAVIGLTKSCALEYGPANIRCVAIAPGFVRTNMVDRIMSEADCESASDMIPMQRMASPGEVAEVVAWLASDRASYVTGSVHQIDGGLIAGFSMRPDQFDI